MPITPIHNQTRTTTTNAMQVALRLQILMICRRNTALPALIEEASLPLIQSSSCLTVLRCPARFRLRTGTPLNANANGDLNGDGVTNDRPLSAPGVPYKRNCFPQLCLV